jgi:hypothetical protein
MTIYLIEGSPATREDAKEYFANHSGYYREDARNIFDHEDAEYIMQECPEIEILTNKESV